MLDEEPDCRPSADDIVTNVYIKKRLTEVSKIIISMKNFWKIQYLIDPLFFAAYR
jgi:hypothetical protein